MLDPALHVQRLGRRVDVVGEGEPAAGVGEGGEPPGGGFVAGTVLVMIERDEDAGGLAQTVDPFVAAGAGGGAGGDGGYGVATRLGDGEGVDLAFDEDDGLVDVKAVGVEEGVGEAGGAEVFGLARGDLGARDGAADVDAPEGAAGEPGDGDAAGR